MSTEADVRSPDWNLFCDWCAARGLQSLPAGRREVERFFAEFPVSERTARRRRQAIRVQHAAAGLADPTAPAPLVTPDPGRQSAVGELLRGCSVQSWPDGIRGRRDAFVLTLFGGLALTRRQIRAVRPTDLQVLPGAVHVLGHRLRLGDRPGECLACGVTRWLRVLDIAYRRDWSAVRGIMAPRWPGSAGDQVRHDCMRPLKPGWPQAITLLPAIDQYGWTDDHAPVSTRVISAVRAKHRWLAARSQTGTSPTLDPLAPGSSSPTLHPKSDWSRQRQAAETAFLGPLFDRLDDLIEESLVRTRRLLDG
ncbi:MAG: hypothetical protein M3Y35_13135 [Actinomycetota bacterium]|nr:hypothetical protein [Actinomycetota bacterium]